MRALDMMVCGHAANGQEAKTKAPICVVCNVVEVSKEPVNLDGRKAVCIYGCDKTIAASHIGLPFFEYKPDRPCDLYYCGCRGYE